MGIYNADVENYLYNLVLVSPSTAPSIDLVQHISMPPPTMEFDGEELKRQNSFRGPPSPSPTHDNSPDLDLDFAKNGGIRGRAQTYAYKIRNRVGSSVSQLSRVVVNESKGSPAVHRKLSTKKKMFSSPQLRKKSINDDSVSRHSSCSTSSDLSARFRESLKEEPEEEEEEGTTRKTQTPRSANTSPTTTIKRSSHKRTRSSDQVIELKANEIELQDIKILLKSGSPEPPISPIDWEVVGNDKTVSEMCN